MGFNMFHPAPFNPRYKDRTKKIDLFVGDKVKIVWDRSKHFGKVGTIVRKGFHSQYWIEVDNIELCIKAALLYKL